MHEPIAVFYWDSSAILSVLFRDRHSEQALAWSNREDALHLMSTLAYAEVLAVVARFRRERVLADVLLDAALEALETGPWRQWVAAPAWDVLSTLAPRWPLRGADLWHLAMARTLQGELPEMVMLTFDERLHVAAEGEGLM